MADRYYASGCGIYQRPRERVREDGTIAHSFGFLVATVDRNVCDREDAARQIASAMNLASMFEEVEMPPEQQILKASLGLG